MGKRKADDSGGSALCGKNVICRREGDDWFYRFNVAGVPYFGSCETTDKRKAEKYAKEIKAAKKVEARRERAAGVGPMKFGAACDAWWDDKGHKNAESGLKYRLDWLRGQIGADKLLKDITPDDITEAQKARALCTRKAGKDDEGRQLYEKLTPAAVKATLVTLRTVINYAGKAKGAACRMYDWPFWINSSDEDEDIRVMSPTEQALIWPYLTDDMVEICEFLLTHPKRVNEALGMAWPRVDLAGETIRIKLKGKKKMVDDPIGPLEIDRLQRLKARRLHPTAVWTYVTDRTRKYNGVQHTKGERRAMNYQHFYDNWTAACEAAGIEDLNPHCLRHTGATRYYWAHPDQIAVVSRMLNHASVSTTIKYYAKHNPELVRDLKKRFAETAAQKVAAKVDANISIAS